MPNLYVPHKRFGEYSSPIDAQRCRAETYNNISRNFSQCARKSAIERDGIGYCRQHDPEAEKARASARTERERAAASASARQWKRPQEYRDALREMR
jgi:hypothetical protein